MEAKRCRATPMSPDERRRAIVEAVIPLLAQHGGQVTTRQIAEAAGIAEGTIFRVFPDKRALFLAAAEHAVTPPRWREDLDAALGQLPTLREKVVAAADRIQGRTQVVMQAMLALRGVLISEGPRALAPGQTPSDKLGPPAFLVESARLLLEAIAELVFAPHRAELRVSPEVAAISLRNLVTGGMHPGHSGADALSVDVVADVLLKGVQA